MPLPARTKILRLVRATKSAGPDVTLAHVEAALDALVDLVAADKGIIAAVTAKGDLEVLAARGLGHTPLLPTDKLVSRTLFRFALGEKQAGVISPLALHPLFADAPSFRATTRSAIAAPLRANGTARAVVMLHEARRSSIFDSEDRESVDLFTDDVSRIVTAYLDARSRADAARPPEPHRGTHLVGGSALMRDLVGRIGKLAASPSPVLVTGERGTGKQLVAEALHHVGPRRGEPFLHVVVSTLGPSVADAELFGSVKGAFTGAENRNGLFLDAGSGTIFLDEIGELSLDVQAKLLGVLQEKTVRAVGASKAKKVRARVIAATNRDLEALVAEGRFRADLLDRLGQLTVETPPLRERLEDLPGLVSYLAKSLAAEELRPEPTLAADVLPALAAHAWPGNVRELEAVLRQAIVLVDGTIHARDLALPAPPGKTRPRKRAVVRRFTDAEVRAAVEAAAGNKRAAARLLDVPKTTLARWIKKNERS